MAPGEPCPCGRRGKGQKPLAFGECCGPFLAGAGAPDAEALMRSRYTAFVLGDESYLMATWHTTTRPEKAQCEPGTKWLGLEVRDHSAVDGQHAEVEFVARYRLAGRGARLHERSRFVKEAGRWYYVDGDLR
ncbi:MAG TPA: YchJ family metal-binding protein [Ramlibacter sp.]|nr:YchJ family metal-binding protein [Ramlibacter sp.]